MQAIAERARQALGLGKDSGFVASSLEPQQKTLEELAVFADPLRRMVSNAEQFKDDTKEFLDSTSKFVLDTPFPRLWAQGSPLEPAVALHTAVPAEHAAWFDRETHETLAQNVTPAVGYALQRELIGPMKQWLLAYDVMKGTYSRLEGRRLAYDAERRHLAAAAAKAADATAAGEAQIASDEASAAGSITAAVEVAQLAEDAAAVSPILTEFEQDVEALDDGLSWLVGGALRLKALVADTAGGVSSAARGWEVPEGLLPELMPSTFGKGYEVTMTVTDAPLGAETLLGPEAPPHATTATPELTQAFSADTIGSVSSDEEMADRRAAAGKMLPSDEMVYGGGVAPPAAAHPPSGGGVTSLIKDTLVGPNPEHRTGAAAAAGSSGDSSSSSRARDAAGIPRDPDLSDQLPADDKMVYGGGVAPSEPAAAPTGRGPAAVVTEAVTGPRSESLDSDHFTDPDPDLDRDAAAAAAAGSSGEGILGKIKGTVTRMLGRSDEEDAAAAAAGSSDESDPVDPQELIQDRKSQSYSHEGVGQVEARSPDVAAAGLGTTGRHLRRARSDEGQAVPGVSLHTGLAVGPEVEIPDADKKQLSTVVLPASPTAAAAETSTATTECYVDNSSTAAAAAEDTAAGSSSSSTGGGLFAAITRTIQEGKARLMGQTNDEQEQEQQQQQEQVEEQVEEEGEDAAAAAAAAATDEQQQQRDESDQGDATWRVDVQGAEESGAPGAPGTPEFVESSTQPTVNPAAGQEPEMQVGPVGDVAEAAPGTAHFEKGPTPPGGAAAATAGEVTGMGNDEYKDVQAGMHIGPTGPTDVVFAKGPTPPGGRVAAAAAAAAAAEAPAGHLDDEPAAAGDGKGPDLSKILPTYENLPTGTTPAKPAGGGVGTFIRDTLLGPPKDQ